MNVDRSLRPLTLRPAAGAAVVFDNTGGGAGASGAFYFGYGGYSSYITMDAAGTGGSFTIQNYDIGDTGLVYAAHHSHITVNGIIVRTCSGGVSGTSSHCLYLASDGTHRSDHFTANGWDVLKTGTKNINAAQLYHDPNCDTVTLHSWVVNGFNRAIYLWSDATGVDLDGWTISNCNVTIDAEQTATGSVKNTTATSSGTTVRGSGQWTDLGITDGGGNSW